MVAVVKGKATKATSLVYNLNGKKHAIKMNNGHFAFSVPVASEDQKVRIIANNGDQVETKLVTIAGQDPLGDYTAFAQMYNYTALQSGNPTDQIPLVVKDGIHKYTNPSGVVLRFNVQGTSLMGISMGSSFKDMKSKTKLKGFSSSLYMICQLTGAKGKTVLKDLAQQLKDAKNGSKSTMKQIESNGVKINIGLASNAYYLYITR